MLQRTTNTVYKDRVDLKVDILSRVLLSEFIQRDVKLIRKGPTFLGLCPFHHEKTPSFTVNDEKGYYHCFGCGERGDIFSYVMHKKGFSFKECLHELAAHFGIPVQEIASQESAHEVRIFALLKEVCALFQDYLRSDYGKEARIYIEGRFLSEATLAQFSIGYAPRGDAILKTLHQRGYSLKEIEQSGLLAKSGAFLFHNRIMFPILDQRSRVVGFGGRLMGSGDERSPKYMNSSQTEFFKKGELLYGLPHAQYKKEGFVVVEGYMDVLTLHQNGIKNAVAPLGTALTEAQITLLWSKSPNVTLCFDGDRAGEKAAYKGIDRILPLIQDQNSIRFCFLGEKEDPDSLINQRGVGVMRQFLDKATSLVEVMWDLALKEHPKLSTPEAKRGLCTFLNQKTDLIQDAPLRSLYRQEFFHREKTLWAQINADNFSKALGYKKKRERFKNGQDVTLSRSFLSTYRLPPLVKNDEMPQKILIAFVFVHPLLLGGVVEDLSMINLKSFRWKRALDGLLESALCDDDFSKTIDKFSDIYSESLLIIQRYLPSLKDNTLGEEKLLEIWNDLFSQSIVRPVIEDEVGVLAEKVKKGIEADDWHRFCLLKKKRIC